MPVRQTLNINIDDLFGRKARQRRETESATLAQQLLEKGVEPEAVNEIASTYKKTGKYVLPDFQTKTLAPTNLFPDGIPTRQPFSLPKKTKALYGFDAEKGIFTDMGGEPVRGIPENVDPEVQRFKEPTANTNQGYDIYVDWQGNELRREPNGEHKNRIVRGGRPGGGGGGAKSPEDQLAMNQIKLYQRALMNGDDISPETMAATRSAAERFNINLEQVDQDPSILDRIMGDQPDPGQPFPQYDGTKKGKTLTRELAAEFRRRANGDKDKARELAKKAGYTF